MVSRIARANLLCSALPADQSLVAANGAHKCALESHDYSLDQIRNDKATVKTIADLAFPLLDPSGALEPIAHRNLGHAVDSAAPSEMGIPLIVLRHQVPLTITNTHIHPRTGNPEFFRIHESISYLGLP